ncbi:MAG: hypothetical protein IJ272_02565 [Clostridia bacterium]|nr:hypothetical protein [Clostridia bacterium]
MEMVEAGYIKANMLGANPNLTLFEDRKAAITPKRINMLELRPDIFRSYKRCRGADLPNN